MSCALVRDAELRTHVSRCAAAADVALDHIDTEQRLRLLWRRAPVLVLDADTACWSVAAGLPRRDGIAVVCSAPPGQRTWSAALRLGATTVATLPDEETQLTGVFAETREPGTSTRGSVVAVVGATGGAGASTFCGALGGGLARRGTDALLVDCDPDGGGLDGVLGLGDDGVRWPELRLADGRITASALWAAIPGRGFGDSRLGVLACRPGFRGPERSAITAVLDAGVRAGATVVCDLPRARLDEHPALECADRVVLLVPARAQACAAGRGLRATFDAMRIEPLLVVCGPAPGGLRPKDVAERLELPLCATVRADPAAAHMVEAGRLLELRRGPWRAAALAIRDELGAAEPDVASSAVGRRAA